MTSTAVLRTPPASTSHRDEYISLRRPKGVKDTGFGGENSPSPTVSILGRRVKTPSDRTSCDSPPQPSPSPLRKRVLFGRGNGGQRDSDDDEPSPSAARLHSPFASRCVTPFIRAWGGHSLRASSSVKPVEDDEGLFLASKVTSPTPTSSHCLSRRPSRNFHSSELTTGTPGFPKLILTPSARKTQDLPVLSPLQPPRFATRTPQTPAETEWYLGRQTESMTKLSLGDDDDECLDRYKTKSKTIHIDKDEELSPSLVPRRRGRKRSLDGNELPRSRGGVFETSADTPPITSFYIPESPSPLTKHNPSATAFFGLPVSPSPASLAKPGIAPGTRSCGSSPKATSGPIAKKYRPRDSGVAGLDEDDEDDDKLGPIASTHTVYEEEASGFITPSLEPPARSAWPPAAFTGSQQGSVDEFIFKTLAAGGAPPKDKKVMPSTPVKRNAYALSRPWMSSSKVIPPPAMSRVGGGPRKSLPLSFPNLSQIQDSPDTPDISPSDRSLVQRKMYSQVGKGRPSMLLSSGGVDSIAGTKAQFPMRRSSSGAFSSSSSSEGSLLGTPTKFVAPESRLPVQSAKISLDSAPQAVIHLAGETPIRRTVLGRRDAHEPSPRPPYAVPPRPLTEHERPGKFEIDFVTTDKLGTGEFGNAFKVRYKRGDGKEVFAIKKSKRFEGIKHRRRLREEVDVLKHLLVLGGHSNVLRYVDSWEQDDALYIQTELCELGNFGTFLAEYGTHFAALDEARVWKVCAELSSGLRFIHAAGVIHLDLKPDNVFVTGEGRFRIGDFGMASLWPRRAGDDFEREGDREYMAPEVLQGRYGKKADVFSFGMIMLETATNIVVPDMGDDWHRLREDDFSAVDFSPADGGPSRSAQLVELILQTMRSDPDARVTIEDVYSNAIVRRAREAMKRKLGTAVARGTPVFAASPLGGEPDGYMEEVLLIAESAVSSMDLSA